MYLIKTLGKRAAYQGSVETYEGIPYYIYLNLSTAQALRSIHLHVEAPLEISLDLVPWYL